MKACLFLVWNGECRFQYAPESMGAMLSYERCEDLSGNPIIRATRNGRLEKVLEIPTENGLYVLTNGGISKMWLPDFKWLVATTGRSECRILVFTGEESALPHLINGARYEEAARLYWDSRKKDIEVAYETYRYYLNGIEVSSDSFSRNYDGEMEMSTHHKLHFDHSKIRSAWWWYKRVVSETVATLRSWKKAQKELTKQPELAAWLRNQRPVKRDGWLVYGNSCLPLQLDKRGDLMNDAVMSPAEIAALPNNRFLVMPKDLEVAKTWDA